ncbi:MAG TPA: peptidylprolyl isomerase [Candidatus Saccharimonadales bacterium]|nr:peptidylprolyl isomerase [Candidatus Saccharimonadales bacterium]
MKNQLKRIKLPKRKGAEEPERPERITNDTVSKHRERILAGGRRFKYPIQYAKHKLIINSIIIVVVALVLMAVLIWQQLYVAQNTSKFMYRITQIIPLPVAKVDGETVRYSDYLRDLRVDISTVQNLNQIDMGSSSGDQQINYYKRQELNKAERDAYARKLAEKMNLSVSDEEVDQVIDQQRKAQHVSMDAYVKTAIEQYYGWSLGEYRDEIRARLIVKKVSFAVDDEAKQRITNIQNQLDDHPDQFEDIAKKKSDDDATKANGGRVGKLPIIGASDADDLVSVAKDMKEGQISDILKKPDGYYIIKLISKDDDSVDFAQIKIGLTKFDDMFAQIKADHKIVEYINIPEIKTQE